MTVIMDPEWFALSPEWWTSGIVWRGPRTFEDMLDAVNATDMPEAGQVRAFNTRFAEYPDYWKAVPPDFKKKLITMGVGVPA